MQRLGRTLANANLRLPHRPLKLSVTDQSPRRAGDVASKPGTIPPPTSRKSLYRNLLFIASNPPFAIQRAIDYYFDWPNALHSTKSFNLLIGLALRSASFASVGRLVSAMRAQSTPENMETWKLQLRWFVRTGRWNDAWKRVLQITGQRNVTTALPMNPIPLPLWLELFGSQQRGALRRWVITDRKPNKDAETFAPLPRKCLLPYPSQRHRAVELSQYQALMRVSPLLASSDRVQILPRTIFIITQTMYKVGQSTLALSTALSYLKSLPSKLRRCDRRRVLDLVHLHLSEAARHRKPGLKRHFAQRHILHQFLHARPDFTPSSATLSLVLKPLRHCRRSGTLAMQCLRLFEKRWGTRVQSSSVRRRVASLALKEGRLDIVVAMIKLEHRCRISDDPFPRTIHTSRQRPWRKLISRRGAENRRWRFIEDVYRRRLLSRPEARAV